MSPFVRAKSWAGERLRGPQGKVLLAGWSALLAVLVWSYFVPLQALVGRWWKEPDYQHCFLVIPFAALLLWLRRDLIAGKKLQGSLWGLALLALCAAMRWASAYFYFALLDPMSLVPCAAGIALLIGGWRALHWAWPSVVFLAFMVPLPGFLAELLSHPLQRAGTIASTYIIQTIGIPAVAHGNVISLSEAELGVVEACSGLRMTMLFVTVCVGAAFLMERSPLEKLIVVLSAAPIALLANVVRIMATAVLHETVSHDAADALFHDLAGWFMMPLAVVFLWTDLWLLSHVLVDRPHHGPLALESVRDNVTRNTKNPSGKKRRKKGPAEVTVRD